MLPGSRVCSCFICCHANFQIRHVLIELLNRAIESSLLLEGTGLSPAVFSIAPHLRRDSTPPTYLVHGDLDDKVPVRQSRDVAAALKAIGVTYQYDELGGQDHLFDFEAHVPCHEMYAFLAKHL